MDLYFEMYSGIAGDMTIGALLDLGASKEKLVEGIKSLGLSGYELVFERVKKNGIDSYNFDVILEGHDHDHNHDHNHHEHDHHHDHNHHEHDHCHCHDHTHEDGHTHSHEHCHDHDHDHEHCHEHTHEEGNTHSHEHCHDHNHDYHHDHVHRNLNDIERIINSSDLNENIKKNALGIFDIIGDAEAKAHGIDKSEVHFHEVGAIDSIIDIVGTCICLDDLGVENIYFSDLYEGFGYQMCAHGPMPIPVPAVANILADSQINLNFIGEEGEHITPTGAAIVKYFYKKAPESFKIKKIGLGAGNKDFEKSTNILRVIEIETGKKKTIKLLETNIDDTSGEILGYALEKIMEIALDCYYSPIFMKKNRPAYKLSVIYRAEDEEKIEDIIFRETTSIGVRKFDLERTILDRKIIKIPYRDRDYLAKQVSYKDKTYTYPEYESAKDLAENEGISLKEAYDLMRALVVKIGK